MKDSKPDEKIEMSAEQAADLAALESDAVGQGVAPEQPGAMVEVGLGQELAGIATALLAVASPMFPSLKPIYTPEVIGAASEAIAGVCKKHGWLSGGVMGEYAEEITALVVCGPLAFATMQAVKVDLARMKAGETETEKPGAAPWVTSAAVPPVPTSASAPPDNVVVLQRVE
ncbi:MAG: hypothetical protein RugAbin2_02417 [Rugosibacter sp.]|nr:hypothetical protein [Rugosibacter sp.]